MLLADMGAEVIKIERPDKKLGSGPYLGGERLYDLSVMRGKKSVTLDAKDPRQHEILMDLIKTSDIIVENFRPGVTERMGVSYEDVVKIKPDIIYTSISGFGQVSPYQTRGALDIVIQAMSGLMSITGEPEGRPLRAGASIADLFTGVHAAYGTMAMILHREHTGEGQHLDIAMLDTLFTVCENAVTRYLNTGKVAKRLGNEHPANACFGDFPTKDGCIILAATKTNTYAQLCRVLGCEEYINDPRFVTDNDRLLNKQACHEIIRGYTSQWDTKELSDALTEAGVPSGMINSIEQACRDESILARDMIAEVKHSVAGNYKLPNSPFKLSKTPIELEKGAPVLGENNREIFGQLGLSADEIDEMLKQQAQVRTMFSEWAMK
jgi:CoA:oxalate CoA-transferase